MGRTPSMNRGTANGRPLGRSNSSLGVRPQMTPTPYSRPASAQGMQDEGEYLFPEGGGARDSNFGMRMKDTSDLHSKLAHHEAEIRELKSMYMESRQESSQIKDKEIQWETQRVTLEARIAQLQMELETYRKRAAELERALEDERRDRRTEREDAIRKLRDETDSMKRQHQQQVDSLERKWRLEMMDEKANRTREVQSMQNQLAMEKQRIEMQMEGTGRESRSLKLELDAKIAELERERAMNNTLRDKISETDAMSLGMESTTRALRARIEALENAGQSQANDYAALERALQEQIEKNKITEEKLRNEEIIRRKLHNQVQELKGNIRVFCRVRPTLGDEAAHAAEIRFPNSDGESTEIEFVGAADKSALGKETVKTHPFQFDKVFGPNAQNEHVFEEISQLVQSALDGYNVCIFCYGQTGSGKTHTMSSQDGMIPRAVHQIYAVAQSLKEKGWTYRMEGNFVEVYNENINDLLGRVDDLDKKKHEIRHDPKEQKTTITGIETVVLENPQQVNNILNHAQNTRSVAATAANERSSRSHSVFILKLIGTNSVTGQRSEGTLNLVDLAGSERLAHSQATGDRLKETQSINRSLACLGDVIAALGSGKEGAHIPYRNSKLTYLLQYSLGGNSKCLMFVMVSPMQAHLSESLTSLKFATKVNNTTIGTAKKVVKA
ncbi:P-loop containing nucleoside triphosphate hydrolase protein [Pyronema omphalodes]|nr:P-loop containing nucleoside triphosphate hydrolase protein [Pyronema omphalodes]